MPGHDSALRLRILEILDRVACNDTQETGICDLRRVIGDYITQDNWKGFIKLVFANANRFFFHKLIPLLVEVADKIPATLIRSESERLLIDALSDLNNHSPVQTAWMELIGRCVLSPVSSAMNLLKTERKDTNLRKGLARIHFISVKYTIDNQASAILDDLCVKTMELLDYDTFNDITAELLEAIAVLVPVECSLIEPAISCYLALVTELLTCQSRIKLNRPLALSCCRFLSAVAHYFSDSDSVLEHRAKIIPILSRDNLSLFSLTRSNPVLRDTISEALLGWRMLSRRASLNDSGQEIPRNVPLPLLESPQGKRKPIPNIVTSTRVVDSPIQNSETSFGNMQEKSDVRSVSPPRILAENSPDDTVSLNSLMMKSSRKCLSFDEEGDIGLTFHELVTQLSHTRSNRTRTFIYDSLLDLSRANGFVDSVRPADVDILHRILASDENSAKSKLVWYKFFGDKQ
jgi:hypothetical protein